MDVTEELRQRNSDLSYMAGERDLLLKALDEIIDYDDGTIIVYGECSSIALKAKRELEKLRGSRTPAKEEKRR